MGPKVAKVCVLGHHEPDYPRNRQIQELIRLTGNDVVLCHSRIPFPFRHVDLARKYMRIASQVDAVYVTEGGHRLVPLAKLLCLLTGKRLIFDPFLSRYNTRIEDRKLHSPNGLQALICLWQDWSSTHCADHLVFDTHEHREFFYSKYRLKKPWTIIPVGVDETVFKPPSFTPTNGIFKVLFYGTYIPLQGIEHVVDAAMELKEERKIHFTLIGKGQTYPEVFAQAQRNGLENVTFLDPVHPEELAEFIARADLCLGIFGTTDKAKRVVPNKVVQAAAMGKAVVTQDSSAIRRYFKAGKDIMLISPGNGKELAQTILRLFQDIDLREMLGRGAWSAYQAGFASGTGKKEMSELLDSAAFPYHGR